MELVLIKISFHIYLLPFDLGESLGEKKTVWCSRALQVQVAMSGRSNSAIRLESCLLETLTLDFWYFTKQTIFAAPHPYLCHLLNPEHYPGQAPDERQIVCDVFIGPESDHWQCLSLTDSLTHSLTHSRLVNLIDVTLACEDANSKLVEVCYCC